MLLRQVIHYLHFWFTGKGIPLLNTVQIHLHLFYHSPGINLTLPTDRRVTNGDRGRLCEEQRHVPNNDDAHKHHRSVGEDTGRGLHKRAILLHLRVLHQHVLARNSHVFEAQEAVVHTIHAQLGANLSDLDSLQRHVRVRVTQLDDEREDAATLALRVQLGNDDAVIGRVSHWEEKNEK